MKSLKDSINESAVNEAKTLIDWDESVYSVSREIESVTDKISDIVAKHPEKLKKVFRNATEEQINDYAAIIGVICIYLKEMADNASSEYDDDDDENEYPTAALDTCAEPAFWEDDMMDQIYNMDHDWQSIQDGEDKADLANEVFNNWNAICKALFGKVWVA